LKEILRGIIGRTPVLRRIFRPTYQIAPTGGKNPGQFLGSAEYWEKRYAAGAGSGVGSYGVFAEFKASVLNEFVATHHVQTVIELGCGDGNQLGLANYQTYLGFDISSTVISKCRDLFASDEHKSFRLLSEYNGERADLALSLDVIFHLVEDSVFEHYMRMLFEASNRYVIIYSSDSDDNSGHEGTHVRHRRFTRWIEENLRGWRLIEHRPNQYPYRGDYRLGSFAEFFIYERT
jgi:SAM-dependent methyltransferase